MAENEGELLMADINIRLTDENGDDLVDSGKLTSLLDGSGVSIDDDKIVGMDNFTINEKRAKIKLSMPHNNPALKTQLETLLLDSDNLIHDGTLTEEHNVIEIKNSDILEVFGDKRMFNRSMRGMTQTWEAGASAGTFYIQSRIMHGVFFQIFYRACNTTRAIPVKDSMGCLARSIIKTIGMNSTYNVTDATTGETIVTYAELPALINGYFSTFINNDILDETVVGYIVNLLMHMMFFRDYASFRRLFRLQVQLIADWLKDSESFVDFDYPHENASYTTIPKSALISGDRAWESWILAGLFSSILKYEDYLELIRIFDLNGGLLIETNLASKFSIDDTGFVYDEPWSNWHVWNYSPYYDSMLFYANPELVYSRNIVPTDHPNYDIIGTITREGETCNRFIDEVIKEEKLLKFAKKNTLPGIQFGKIQTETLAETTENGSRVEFTDTDNPELGITFTRVKRTFGLASVESDSASEALMYKVPENRSAIRYKFLIENIDPYKAFDDPTSTSVFRTTSFSNDNWMYFDNIVCREQALPIPINDPGGSLQYETYVDNLPCFDEEDESQIDDFGLYIYKDFFTKYYTKNKSKLMNIYLEVNLGTQRIYTGIVDFGSVSIVKNDSISFGTTDAIGVMIENMNKLADFVTFSQFDTGNQFTADIRAGSTLRSAIETVIRQGYPYATRFRDLSSNFSFDTSDYGVDNKILEDVSMPDALIAGIQCSQKILTTDAYGRIYLKNFNLGEVKAINSIILSEKDNTNIDADLFTTDNLSVIAGWNSFAPEITSTYMSIRNKYSINKELELLSEEIDINLLDKIEIDNEEYIVLGIKHNLRS